MMISKGRLSKIALVKIAILSSQYCWAWGGDGHQLIAEVASRLTGQKSFWAANESNLGMLANVPDKYWKRPPSSTEERVTHYYEPDGYFDDISDFIKFPRKWKDAVTKYGEKKLKEHGTAVWRAQQLQNLAIRSAIQGDFKTALETAGTMAHYVGDLSQPLHVTTNYDGQLTNQKGIHKFFETTNLNDRDYEAMKQEVFERAKALMSDKNFVNENRGSMESIIFNSVNRSYPGIEEILEIDTRAGRTDIGAEEMYDLALNRMADGAATLAIVLNDIWKKANNPTVGQTVLVSVPAWIAPKYDDMARTGRRRYRSNYNTFSFFKSTPSSVSLEEDCQN